MNEKYLPIGTICEVKNESKAVMIIGYLPKPNEAEDIYDYSAVTFPEGLISSEMIFAINNNQISKILFEGYTNPESEAFVNEINNFVKENNIKINGSSPSLTNQYQPPTPIPGLMQQVPPNNNPLEKNVQNEIIDVKF